MNVSLGTSLANSHLHFFSNESALIQDIDELKNTTFYRCFLVSFPGEIHQSYDSHHSSLNLGHSRISALSGEEYFPKIQFTLFVSQSRLYMKFPELGLSQGIVHFEFTLMITHGGFLWKFFEVEQSHRNFLESIHSFIFEADSIRNFPRYFSNILHAKHLISIMYTDF
jgi:hypothetical protein